MFILTEHLTAGRRRIAAVAVLLLVLVVVAAWVVRSSADGRTEQRSVGAPATGTAEPDRPSSTADVPAASLAPITGSADPRAFTESVALALFEWDTASPIPLSDYTGRLVAVADPSGVESPGLVADVTAYLPNAEAWTTLREYYTRQWLEITAIDVPDKWGQALDEAGDNLAPGTTAYTIHGIRHRVGHWEGDEVTSTHEVAFTVFIVCGPTYETCHLLRLSRLDEPLD